MEALCYGLGLWVEEGKENADWAPAFVSLCRHSDSHLMLLSPRLPIMNDPCHPHERSHLQNVSPDAHVLL